MQLFLEIPFWQHRTFTQCFGISRIHNCLLTFTKCVHNMFNLVPCFSKQLSTFGYIFFMLSILQVLCGFCLLPCKFYKCFVRCRSGQGGLGMQTECLCSCSVSGGYCTDKILIANIKNKSIWAIT